jgi:hypothetical protein
MVSSAVVARVRLETIEYFAVAETGEQHWVWDSAQAATFDSMRDATRHALRLPSAMRAFALPTPRDAAGDLQRHAA